MKTPPLIRPKRGRPSQDIWLSVEGFKLFALIAGTQRGHQVRMYFINLEKAVKQVASGIANGTITYTVNGQQRTGQWTTRKEMTKQHLEIKEVKKRKLDAANGLDEEIDKRRGTVERLEEALKQQREQLADLEKERTDLVKVYDDQLARHESNMKELEDLLVWENVFMNRKAEVMKSIVQSKRARLE